MKKLISLLLVLALTLSSVVALVACEEDMSYVEEALALASEMTLDELVAAAKEEIGDETLTYTRMSSTTDKAAAAFTELYGINAAQGDMGSKDSVIYTALDTAMSADAYCSDIMIIQNTAEMMLYVNSGDLLNFSPFDTSDLADSDVDPLVWITCCKQFTYTKTNADDAESLYNVWQLTGLGDDAITDFSLQNPTTESINMSWLVMLTADEYVADLESAYESYFGVEWSASDDYANYDSVSYYFITKMLRNVSTWHTSDTTTCESMATYLVDPTSSSGIASGTVAWVPYAKVKDIQAQISDLGGDSTTLLSNFEFCGNTSSVEGFAGFAYKMYIQIPRTAKYPYAAALFATYLLTEDGVENSCGSYYGYYSSNTSVDAADGKAITEWTDMVVEDADYIYDNYDAVSKFVFAVIG